MATPEEESGPAAGENAALASRAQAWVDEHREEVVEHLRGLVEIETPSEDPEAFEAFFERLAGDLEEVGLATERVLGDETGGWLEAGTPGEHEEIQLLLGHADTVWPEGTLADRDPGVREGDFYGPGALDMKAGLTQLVFALRALDELDLDPALPVHVLVSSDEEIGSPESLERVKELAERANRVFVLEPASGPEGRFKTARKTVARFVITIEGKAAHAGIEPEEGASATEELASLIQRLNALGDPEKGLTVNVGTVEAGLRANVVAPEARIEVDVRARTEEDARHVKDEIESLEAETEGTSLRIEGGFGRPPMRRTRGNRALWRRVKDLAGELGLEASQTRSGGGSDGNYASQHAPTIDGFGAVGEGAHQTFEHVRLDRLRDRIALLCLALLDDPIDPS